MSHRSLRAPRRVPGAPRRTSRDRVATAARRGARHPIRSGRALAAEVRHPYGVPVSAPAPVRHRRRARHSETLLGGVLRLTIVHPDLAEVADYPQVRDNPSMDPVVIALAQLVRDRWANERRARADRRRRLRAAGGEPA